MAEFRDRPGEADDPDEGRRHEPDRPGQPDQPDPPEESDRSEESDRPEPEERWDPVVSGYQRFSSFELGREAGWLDGPDRPARLADTRPYDERGGLAEPAPKDQWALEEAVPKDDVGEPDRYPDVREPWFELVNDGGPDADPFRGNNCLDCSLSAISTWHGEPTVAAPRYPEYYLNGQPSELGETRGWNRAQDWLGHTYERVGQGRSAYEAIAEKLHEGGDGAAAAIINEWPNGGVSPDERREIDLYEFEEGYVAWTVLPPRSDPTQLPDVIGGSCIVIDKATGDVAIRPRLDPESVAEFYRQERHGDTSA